MTSDDGAGGLRLREDGDRRVRADAMAEHDAVTLRERAVAAREQSVLIRETHVRLQEELIRARQQSEPAPANEVERLMDQVREANERLVLATLHAQALTEDADRANGLKDEFLAIVSHELRTPLNAVLGWARMLGSKQLQLARADHAVEAIERNAAALTNIIDDLLDVSRIVAGNLQIDHRMVDPATIAAAAVEVIRPTAAMKNLRIEVATGLARQAVRGDAARLQQAISNLLSNAIKFTPQGGRIDVSVLYTSTDVEVRISDTGEGINPDFLPHVFERFRQGDTGTTRRTGGLGLGLAIVRRLVELHGGTVRAESAGVNHGATFIISLPLTDEGTPARPLEPRRAVPILSFMDTMRRLDGVRVMLVDDNPDSRDVISVALEEAGAAVTAVTSVQAALAAISRVRPDVLVSDIGLPDEDGYALIRRVREREARDGGFLPALALTGFARAEDREHALDAGFQLHIVKPVDPAELTRVIAGLIAPPTS